MHVIIWEYDIRPETRDEFERVYGAEGTWARCFGKGTGYLGTSLYRDNSNGDRYLTLDRWVSADAFETFRETFEGEYEAIDADSARLTVDERRIGAMTT